jgi:hypothetical protein
LWRESHRAAEFAGCAIRADQFNEADSHHWSVGRYDYAGRVRRYCPGTIEMVERGAGNVSPALPIFGLPCILVIDILLIRQLSKLISAALSPNRVQAATRCRPCKVIHDYLPHYDDRANEVAASVTDNTNAANP